VGERPLEQGRPKRGHTTQKAADAPYIEVSIWQGSLPAEFRVISPFLGYPVFVRTARVYNDDGGWRRARPEGGLLPPRNSVVSAADAMNTDAKPTYKHPILWVPTSYFAMGTVYTMVTTAANIMFANLGFSNEQSALYSSLTGFAFTFKPLWAPLLELGKTKKFFVVLMQLILAGVFMALAAALKLPAFVAPAVGLLMIAALAGATQDLVTDGVYVTTLSNKHQAAFSGVQSMSWSIGPIVAGSALVLLVGKLAGEGGGIKPSVGAYSSAWMITFILLGALMLGMAIWHTAFLPQGSKAADAPKSLSEGFVMFGRVFVTFFQKKDVWKLIGFAFFYRFGLGLLDKVSTLFLLDSRAHGGLGLDNSKLGLLNGIATAAFIIGSLVGGWFVARRGLKRSLLILCLFLNVPNVTFLYLGWVRPESLWIIGLIFCIEKLGWGIGAVGHMVYMMQQIAPGPYRMAHYAFATGFGLSMCMTVTGAASGYIQQAVGYQTYFIIVLLAAAPSLLFTAIAPFHHGDASAEAAAK
jgi:PAT family beta-lactamase induction signal transducer AmpG